MGMAARTLKMKLRITSATAETRELPHLQANFIAAALLLALILGSAMCAQAQEMQAREIDTGARAERHSHSGGNGGARHAGGHNKHKPKPAPTVGADAERDWGNTGTDFNANASWSAGTGGVAPGAGDVAWFKVVKSTNPNLSASKSISGLYFSSTASSGYTLSATSPFVLTLTGTATNTGGTETGDTTAAAIGANNTSGTNTISAPLALAPASGSTSTFTQAAGGTLVVSGVVSGTGITLNLPGSGIVTLSGPNTYSGGTTISAGTVNIGNASALGSGGLTISSGTLDLKGFSIALANLSGAGTITNANTVGAATLTVGSDNTSTTFSGTLVDGTGQRIINLTKTGTGVLTLSGADSNTNTNVVTTINGGVLRLNNAAALETNALLTINGGVLELQNPTSFTRTLGTASQQVQITGGTSGFSAFGSAATINLNNNASTIQWGSATFNPTTLVLNETTATAALTFQNGIDLNAANRTINVNANTATVSGAIVNNGGGTAGLIKGGAGTLVLNNANTYNGATTINGGTLKLDNNNTTTARLANTSGITVNSGGTLLLAQTGVASTDRINNSATMALNGGTFNTGGLSEHGASNNTAGIGALTLQSTSIIDMGSGASIIAFANSHLSSWSGTLDIYNWTGVPVTGNGIDQLFVGTDNTGLTASQLAEVQFFSGNGTGSYGMGALILSDGEIVAIPEPGTWLAAALTLVAVSYTQRRRILKKVRVVS
jgi:autotransporter-associated beta strand protein